MLSLRAACVLVLFMLAGCSTNAHYNAFKQNFDIVFNQPKPTELSWEDIASRSTDVIRIRLGDGPHAYLSSSAASPEAMLYRSADNVVLVFRHGRLIRTAGMKDDLQFSVLSTDHLQQSLSITLPSSINVIQDWQQNAGIPLSLTLTKVGEESFSALDLPVNATKFVEQVRLDDNIIGENYYWFSATGVLLKSVQLMQSTQRNIEILWMSNIVKQGNI